MACAGLTKRKLCIILLNLVEVKTSPQTLMTGVFADVSHRVAGLSMCRIPSGSCVALGPRKATFALDPKGEERNTPLLPLPTAACTRWE